jgi:hypothetical protein
MIGNPRQMYRSESSSLDHGLGIEVWNTLDGRLVEGLVAKDGHTPGYATLVVCAPETGMTAFWVGTNDTIDLWPVVAAGAEPSSAFPRR